MFVKNLTLSHFRNYDQEDFSFHPRMNVIIGHNAQGKTNLIESLYYLSLCRSFRVLDDQALIQQNQDYATISCEIQEKKKSYLLRTIIHEKGKSLFFGKTSILKTSEFIGLLNVVLFSPEDLYLFSQAPRYRRRFIDQELMKVSKKYLFHLNRFNAVLKERNSLLKKNLVDEAMLDVLDIQLVEAELIIIQARSVFIKFLNQWIESLFESISGMKLKLQIVLNHGIEINQLTKESLLESHKNSRVRDIETKVTNVGIHRADMTFLLGNQDLLMVASQGQKRLVMIAFKLSILRYIEFVSGKKAIVLLDDVLSELDENRQLRLLKSLNNDYQCFITTTHLSPVLNIKDMNVIKINNGSVQV